VFCGPSQGTTPGLVVGADGITIDLNGHTVAANVSVGHTGGTGILNAGHNDVTIRDGRAPGIVGISLEQGATDNRVVGLVASGIFSAINIQGSSGNTAKDSSVDDFSSIDVSGSPRTRIVGTRIGGGGLSLGAGSDSSVVQGNNALRSPGDPAGTRSIVVQASSDLIIGNGASSIDIAGGSGNVVGGNVVVNSFGDGIHVASGAANAAVLRNFVAVNDDDGIDVDAASARVVQNIAVNNGDYGIEAVPGVFAFGNRASRNGNPAQCLNVSCQPGP
jgi:hypothetical protein